MGQFHFSCTFALPTVINILRSKKTSIVSKWFCERKWCLVLTFDFTSHHHMDHDQMSPPRNEFFYLHDIYFISIFFKVFYKKRGVVKNGQLFVIFFAVFVPYITIIGVLKRILQKEKVIFTQLLGSPIPPILLLCHNMVGERYSIRVKSYEGHGKCIFETPHNDMKCVLSCN